MSFSGSEKIYINFDHLFGRQSVVFRDVRQSCNQVINHLEALFVDQNDQNPSPPPHFNCCALYIVWGEHG